MVEQKTYANAVAGSAHGTKANFFIVGGTPANDLWNTFSLQVSAPAKTAYLNSGASNHDYVDAIDYRALLSANAGAAVTLNAASTDDLMARNRDQAGAAIVIPGINPAPAAFDGQFIQVDIDSVSLAP